MSTTDPPIFARPDGSPLSEDHHLAVNSRGNYFIRATVDAGKGLVGRRITVQTGTSDRKMARLIRNAVVLGWIKAGLLTRKVVLTNNQGEV